jgi:hypothetical protein
MIYTEIFLGIHYDSDVGNESYSIKHVNYFDNSCRTHRFANYRNFYF